MAFVSYMDAAEFIGMSPSSIARYVETGMLPIYELPSPTGGSPVRRVRTEVNRSMDIIEKHEQQIAAIKAELVNGPAVVKTQTGIHVRRMQA